MTLDTQTQDGAQTAAMFGVFDLKEGCTLATFRAAFAAFSEHLQARGFLTTWRVFKRSRGTGYDADFPDREIMVEMCFVSRAAALESWDYVAAGGEGVSALHRRVNAQLSQFMFVLFEDVTAATLEA